MGYRWTSLLGNFDFGDDLITFHGETRDWIDVSGATQTDGSAPGIALCDAAFSGGTIRAKIRFQSITPSKDYAGIILGAWPGEQRYLILLLGTPETNLLGLRYWNKNGWASAPSASSGSDTRRPGHEYDLRIVVKGSSLRASVDGVELISTSLPGNLSASTIGLWTFSQHEVVVTDFHVETAAPRAFVVMQYTTPYNELYAQVIKPICEKEFKIQAHRSDETFGPGVIIADIERQIDESKIVIAEITPTNANVYYEVGYAHALKKPTILIAESRTSLPFDVSPFRVLMYDNTIDGKSKIETGLRNHLQAILTEGR